MSTQVPFSFEKNVHTFRTESGVDVYALKTPLEGVVHIRIGLFGGTHASYDNEIIPLLQSDILPAGTKALRKRGVLETFERLGARVDVSLSSEHLEVHVVARTCAFEETLKLVLDTLTTPRWATKDFNEASTRLAASLEHEKEETSSLAHTALLRALYAPGHPHYSRNVSERSTLLARVSLDHVREFHTTTLTGAGGVLSITGDVHLARMLPVLTRELNRLPHTRVAPPSLKPDALAPQGERDLVLPQSDKMNVHTYLGIPLALTRVDRDYLPLSVGVAILGGSVSSRLFHTLRTKKSLTYGSYASLAGFQDGYPGYLEASALFPSDVFVRGRRELRSVVRAFIENGVTASELARKKDELTGKFLVGTTSASGLATSLFMNHIMQRPVSYLDTYPELVRALSTREVNRAILEHLDYSRAVTSASGTIEV